MTTEIKVPELGESITEATVANWLKKKGDTVKKDEPLVELDTEKVTLEVNAPADGTLSEIKAEEDSDVEVGSVLGLIEEDGSDSSDDKKDEDEEKEKDEKDSEEEKTDKEDKKKKKEKQEAASKKEDEEKEEEEDEEKGEKEDEEDAAMSPSVRRLIEEKNLDPKKIQGSGKKGRITKSDVMDYLDKQEGDGEEDKAEKEDKQEDKEEEEKEEKEAKPSGGGETKDIVVPELGESVSEATIAQWFKKEGDAVKKDEALVELETEKVSLEVNAEADGVLAKISAEEGEDVEVGAVIGAIEVGAEAKEKEEEEEKEDKEEAGKDEEAEKKAEKKEEKKEAEEEEDGEEKKREGREHYPHRPEGPREERVKMSRLRQSVAKRLKEAQDNAAMLTTFNEVDMSAVMEVRNKFKDSYEDKHGVRLGFMSFFIKACIVALREIPEVNAEIDGNEIVYKNHYDIGVAVGSPQGLVVPVVRDADVLTFAEIEKAIRDFARQAHEGTLKLEDMTGGTFTISNGGVYGSMLSTPILNPPQSGILGMHNIEQRAMVMDDGSIEARPMMYLALSYDHRIVDGRGAVTFLKRVKECIEDPERIMLDI